MSYQISNLLLNSFEKSAQEESLRHAGDRTIEYTRKMKMFGYVACALLFGALLYFGLTVPPADRLPAISGLGSLFLLMLALAMECGLTRITYEERGIRTRSAWRFSRFIPFSAIRNCHYSFSARWYQIRTQHYGTIRISIYMRGIPDLLKILPYPPVNKYGEALGNPNAPQILPATIPIFPANRSRAKLIAAFLVILGLGSFVGRALYPMPDRAHFTELQGQVTEMSSEPLGKRDVLLKLRLADAPALLTWSSDRAKGASLDDLFKEMRSGDQVRVLIAKSDLANASKIQATVDAPIRFVGLRTQQKEYLSFESHLLWHRETQHTFTLAGVTFLVIATSLFFNGQKKAEVP